MKRIRCFAAVFCLLLLLAGCAGEPKVKRTIEGMKTYAEMTDGTWTCDGRSYAYRLEIRGRLHSAATTTPAAVLRREIGEAPEIPDADCAPGSREHEAELPGKMIRFLFHDVQRFSLM